MNVIVNGRPIEVDGDIVYYEDLCMWVNVDPTHIVTVTWSTRTSQGTLTPGQSCTPSEGMVFNVADTSNA